MININGIKILDSWDGSKENISVQIAEPTLAIGSFTPLDQEPLSCWLVVVFQGNKPISEPYKLLAFPKTFEKKMSELTLSLKKVFGQEIKI